MTVGEIRFNMDIAGVLDEDSTNQTSDKMFSTSKKFKQWKQWYLHAYIYNNKKIITRRHMYTEISFQQVEQFNKVEQER